MEVTTQGSGYNITDATNGTDTFFFYKTQQVAFLCVLFVLTVTANCIVLALIYLSRKLKSRMNMFIANLACAARRCRILIGLNWSCAVIFSIPMLLSYNLQLVDGHMPQCWMELPKPWMWKVYITLIAILLLIIPAVIIAFCYIFIVIVIWRKSSLSLNAANSGEQTRIVTKDATSDSPSDQRKRVHWTECNVSSRGLIPKAKIKTIKMTFVIVLAFVFCWSPYFVYDLLDVYGHIPRTNEMIAVSTFIQSLAPLNSAANPIIYMLFNSKMYKKFFKSKKHNSSPSTSATRSHV
ncbi:cardioacceleratory peptide receptor-like isoform X2 [Mizuhopecten yessoensis]|uniref:cardioacceleratory peptide receptor-like isoform X2 n=1 Tax=Mizuhopecten yessoensis TaxID=6573 RepID=UPI000B45DD28|nr:cardioacceleratory peptide receptor-like isoform X2 [Mizuhopecten yessoensis]